MLPIEEVEARRKAFNPVKGGAAVDRVSESFHPLESVFSL
jgi:hypothetical protein